MYRKLMFLISFVALLVLSNVTFAADIWWDGGGTGDSFCTPENWVGDVLPGPDDKCWTKYRSDGENHIVIDCEITTGRICMPYAGDPCLVVLDFVTGGVINCHSVLSGRGLGGENTLAEWNFTGTGTLITPRRLSLSEKGYGTVGSVTTLNMSDNSLISAGSFKTGSVFPSILYVNINDNSIFNLAGVSEFEDDGEAHFTLNSGSVNCGGNWIVKCRMGDNEFFINGGEWYIGGALKLGMKTGGNDPSVHALLDMSNGILNTGSIEMSGNDARGDTTINVSGGLMVCRGTLLIKDGKDAAQNQVNLSGTGVIRAADLVIADGNNGFSIEDDGTLILDGDKLAEVYALVAADKLLACGGDQRGISADYDVTNPGRTTVIADCTFDECKAWSPWPADGETEIHSVTTDVVLEWIEGDCLGTRGRNAIYFGTDPVAVENATLSDPEHKDDQNPGQNTYNIGNLPLWTWHYWRIDQLTQTGTTKGDVWSFKTGCAAIAGDINNDCIVNFLDYAYLASTFGEKEYWPE